MAKRFDYYAGYPNQQKTPKWVGITLGSLFGVLTLIMLGVGMRLVMPARTAEASVAPVAQQTAPVVAAPSVEMDESALAVGSDSRSASHRSSRHHGKAKKSSHVASSKPAKQAPPSKNYKKAQMFAKSVSGSRRDKRARDDLDKMLGL